MNPMRLALGCLLLVILFASSAWSQTVRTFVASTGLDTNPCSRTAPCRTFNAALAAVSAGGEVVALDSAGFGSNVTINKAVSVISPGGVFGGIWVPSGDGITISAGPSEVVNLRGLTLNGQGGTNGINFISGAAVHVENCVVNGFGMGIRFTNSGKLFVKDSTIRKNITGIFIGTTGPIAASIDHVRLTENTGAGLDVVDGAKVSIRNSVSSGNATGINSTSTQPAGVEVNVENCLVAGNANGIASAGDAGGTSSIVRMSDSTVTDNQIGLVQILAGALLSRGNNTVEG